MRPGGSGDTPERIVVVGASMAGASAVETLRRAGYAGAITLIGAEPHLPYERPPLSKGVLTGTAVPESVFLRDAAFYAQQAIQLRLGTRAVALDVAGRAVSLPDGERIAFDRLLIATGGVPRHLSVPGADLPGVVYLRTLDDALALAAELQALAESGARLVVVGAGFIGSEVAAAARTRGVAVTMLDVLPVPLDRALGPRLGAIYAEIHRAHGVDLRLGESVAALRGRERVEEVVTERDETIACGLVVVGIGMRPADDWLLDAGVTLHDGVLVDAYCESSVPGIFAAGDVARWPLPPEGARVRLEHYDNALRQGEAAARNMLGARLPYAPVPYFWSDQYDLKLQMVGHAPGWDDVVLRGEPASGSFAAFYVVAGAPHAAVAVNRTRELVTLRKLVAARTPVDAALLADEQTPLKALV